MDSSTLETALHHFKSNKHHEVMKSANMAISRDPFDLDARYCYALSAIFTGKSVEGLTMLDSILHAYLAIHTIQNVPKEIKRFVGDCALQLAEMVEISKRKELYTSFETGVKLAETIGTELANSSLLGAVKELKKKMHYTEGGSLYIRSASPYILQVEPTNHCNLACRMCPREKMTRPIGFMEPTLFEQIMATWESKTVKYSGTHVVFNSSVPTTFILPRKGLIKLYFLGETFLHPQFDVFIRTARENGAFVEVQTNGTLLHLPKIRKRILEAGPSGIAISLDGIDISTYNSIRQGSDCDRVFNAIKEFSAERKALGMEPSMQFNISTILPELSLFNEQKAKSFLNSLAPYVDKVSIIPLDRSFEPDFFDETGEIYTYAQNSKPAISLDKSLCEEALDKMNILWDGTATPCCHDINGNLALGVIPEQGVDAIWQTEKAKNLYSALIRHDVRKFKLCQSCTV